MKETFIDGLNYNSSSIFNITLAGVSYCDGTYRINRPKSLISCIEYIYSGKGTIKTKGGTYTAKEGDCYFLLQGEDQEYFSDADEPWTKIWVNMDGGLVKTLAGLYGVDNNPVVKCDISQYILKIHTILSKKSNSTSKMMDECAILVHRMFLKMSNHIKNQDATFSVPSTDGKILKDYIDKNTTENISITTLSNLIYKSPSQTIRIFKKEFGITPYEYHLQNKLTKAVTFLESTRLSVKEIAFYLGFTDEHYFSNIFKNKMGHSPSYYRKKDNDEQN